jgi:hypothetical protein
MSPIQAVCAASTKKKRIQKEMGMTPLCQKNSLADADDAQIKYPARNAWGPKFLNMVVL